MKYMGLKEEYWFYCVDLRDSWCGFVLFQFITDISLTIDTNEHGGSERLQKILAPYNSERRSSCFKVFGTYQELKKLVEKLLSAGRGGSSASHRRPRQQTPLPSAHVRPVNVSSLVLDYIQQKCLDKLHRIQGDSFVLETLSDHHGSVQVTFKPKDERSQHHDQVRFDFVRQRFITFYQRIASDLQVTSLPLRSDDLTDLCRRFPLLLFKPHPNRGSVTVTGTFAHVAKLEEFLSQKPSTSKSPVTKSSANIPRSESSDPSLKQKQRPEDESCPICMETIKAGVKTTLRCKHFFCRDCLETSFRYKPVCPICGEVYGTLRGTQPEGGTMHVTRKSSSLPGYEKYETIVIRYYIPSGIQKVRAAEI